MNNRNKEAPGQSRTVLTADEIRHALDVVNMWIGNCDAKAATALAFFGVIVSLLLSDNAFIESLYSYIVASVLMCVLMHISCIGFVVGIGFLISVIIPRIEFGKIKKAKNQRNMCSQSQSTVNENDDENGFNSYLFYGSIATRHKDYKAFTKSVHTNVKTTDVIADDLLFQLFSASTICNKKMNRFKYGMWILTLSSVLHALLLIIADHVN